MDLGQNFIKIGPEMVILAQFSILVRNTLIFTEIGFLYVLKMAPLTTSGNRRCAVPKCGPNLKILDFPISLYV